MGRLANSESHVQVRIISRDESFQMDGRLSRNGHGFHRQSRLASVRGHNGFFNIPVSGFAKSPAEQTVEASDTRHCRR